MVELRKTLPTFGARRLIREFDLPISYGALGRIWRVHGLMQKRRRKYLRKADIRARWALFQQISADTKDLDDILAFGREHNDLPKDPALRPALSLPRIQQHLDRCAVSLRDLVWQTDNGGEFKGEFPNALGDSQHVRIPPSAHTYQSDVETVHRLEEDEFFDLEDFSSRGDFLAKAHTYRLYFNLVRPQLAQGKSEPPGRSSSDFPALTSPLCFLARSLPDTMCLGIPSIFFCAA